MDLIGESVVDGLDTETKKLLLDVAKIKKSTPEQRAILGGYVRDGSAKKPQVSAAETFLKKLGKKPFDVDAFNESCGIGFYAER